MLIRLFALFSGTLPSSLGTGMTSLSLLTLHFNQLNGTVPYGLGGISYLLEIELNDNGFTGTLPADLANCTDLEVIRMDSNQFTGRSWMLNG